jgi:hypothetical protein
MFRRLLKYPTSWREQVRKGLYILAFVVVLGSAPAPVEPQVQTLLRFFILVANLLIGLTFVREIFKTIVKDYEKDFLNYLFPYLLVYSGVVWCVGHWGDAAYRWCLAHPQQSATTTTGLGILVLILGFNAVGKLFRQLRYRDNLRREHSHLTVPTPSQRIIQFQHVDLEAVLGGEAPMCHLCQFFAGHLHLRCAVNPKYQPGENCTEFEPRS